MPGMCHTGSAQHIITTGTSLYGVDLGVDETYTLRDRGGPLWPKCFRLTGYETNQLVTFILYIYIRPV